MGARLKIWLILVIAVVAAVAYSLSDVEEVKINGMPLRKLNLSSITDLNEPGRVSADSAQQGVANKVDTTRQRVLFFGDSMTSGLFYRLDDYCQANGHKLYSFTWYSATTQSFAESNILDTYIRRYNPSFVIICLGSNELFVRDLDARKGYIAKILTKIGNRPYVWVSPPNWKKDTGMDSIICKSVGGKRFFNSSALTLQRSDDHIHPTLQASAIWMDRIAEWLNAKDKTAHPIIMRRPGHSYPHTFTDYYPTDFKGFTGNDTPEKHRRYFK